MASTEVRRLPAPSSSARGAARAVVIVGGVFTGVSIYWGLGGTALLETVGGSLAAGGRAGSVATMTLLWATVGLKLAATLLPMTLLRAADPRRRRMLRLLVSAEAVVLTGYGLLMSVVGWLVQAGVIPPSPTADQHALAWHAWLWDPWFLLWGMLVWAVLFTGRPRWVRR